MSFQLFPFVEHCVVCIIIQTAVLWCFIGSVLDRYFMTLTTKQMHHIASETKYYDVLTVCTVDNIRNRCLHLSGTAYFTVSEG
jgi:hypothetical protein